MKNIRIFISSPGDVQLERNIARNVINELSSLYTKHAKFEILMWEDFPLSAHSTFQDGINYFLENKEKPIDIAVFILWSRLGTPLDHKYVKADGTLYQSGTEYEFDLMMHMHRTTNLPSRILTYLKKDDRFPNVLNYEDLSEKLNQKKKLDSFIKEYFRDDATNSNYAYMPFGENNSFEKVFRTHIQNAIKDILGDIDDIKEWEGNPYVGLNSFEYKDSAIFFGRRQLVYETASKLITQDDNNHTKKSLIVLGESGSGKSSFIKAGLLPFFCNKNTSTQYVVVHPSMYGGKMYDGLLDLLNEKIECLKNHPFMEELREGITNATNFKHLLYALEHHEDKLDLIVYIDQFEELFSDNSITEEERQKVLLLLRGLINMRCITIFMSMRSDFYNRFSLYEEMNQIKQNCEVVDLPVLGPTDITEIVEEPARKACLKWEITDKGLPLNERIIKEASNIKDLPFIEFALSQLFETRTNDDYLTHAAYEQMGGLKGAIINYADKCYTQLSESEKKVFNDILGFVITESSSHKGIYVRKTSAREDIEKTSIHKEVIDKMLNARLFVAGKDSHGRPTITITHEILLKSWDVIVSWIKREKEFIASNNHYEQLAQHWINNKKSKKDLIKGRSPLLEAEYFHYKNHSRITDDVLSFLNDSFRKEKRSGLVWRIIASIFLCLNFAVLVLFRLFDIEFGIDIVDDIKTSDWILFFTAIILIAVHSIILRFKGLPEYQTIKTTILIWSISTILLLLFSSINQPDFESIVYASLFPLLPVFLYLIKEIREYIRRKRWNNQFTPYRVSDEFWNQSKTIAIASMIVTVLFLTGFTYGNKLQETTEEQSHYVSTLLDVCDNLSGNLSYDDIKALNSIRKEYLVKYFKDDLMDTIYDERELQYARALYNLQEPDSSIIFLYPNRMWTDHLFWILSTEACGMYDEANRALQLYVEGSRFDAINNNITTLDLIWIAEKHGDFESAKTLYEYVEENKDSLNCLTFDTEPSYYLNMGHVYLYEGNFHKAQELYTKSFRAADSIGNIGWLGSNLSNMMKNSLKSDLHVLSRFNAISDDMLNKMANIMDVEFKPAFVPISCVDSTESAEIYKYLEGNWVCQDGDSRIELHMDENYHLFTYTWFNEKGEESYKTLAELRIGRMNNELYWDEFGTTTDSNSFSKIISLDDDCFVLEIIENGNPSDKGKLRKYERVE